MSDATPATLPLPAACIRAKRSRERLMTAIYCGHIAAEKVGGAWIVDAASLAAFLAREAATRPALTAA